MNSLEYFFLDLGLSWTYSKLIPYVLAILFGAGFSWFLLVKIKKQSWLKFSSVIGSFVLPFIIYFTFFPIYEGDFSNLGVLSNSTIPFPQKKTLTVVVLPNCPFCYQSIRLMKKLKERKPEITIQYWISTSDTLSRDTKIFKVIPDYFTTFQKYNKAEISKLVQDTYPCFILSKEGKSLKQWNNNHFGVSALDEIERFFN